MPNRKRQPAIQKAQIVLEAIREDKSVAQIAIENRIIFCKFSMAISTMGAFVLFYKKQFLPIMKNSVAFDDVTLCLFVR